MRKVNKNFFSQLCDFEKEFQRVNKLVKDCRQFSIFVPLILLSLEDFIWKFSLFIIVDENDFSFNDCTMEKFLFQLRAKIFFFPFHWLFFLSSVLCHFIRLSLKTFIQLQRFCIHSSIFFFLWGFIHSVSSLMTYFADEYLPLKCTFSKSVSLSFVRSLIHWNHINFNFVLVFIRFSILALCRFQFENDFFLMSFWITTSFVFCSGGFIYPLIQHFANKIKNYTSKFFPAANSTFNRQFLNRTVKQLTSESNNRERETISMNRSNFDRENSIDLIKMLEHYDNKRQKINIISPGKHYNKKLSLTSYSSSFFLKTLLWWLRQFWKGQNFERKFILKSQILQGSKTMSIKKNLS